MAYTEPESFAETASRLVALAERLRAIRTAHSYSDPDARAVALNACCDITFVAVMVLNVLDAGAKVSENKLKGILRLTSGTVQSAAALVEQMQRLGLLVLFQFQIENLFANLLRALQQGKQPPMRFYLIAKEMVSGLPDAQRKLELLNVPALIRNSLHANGIHHGYNGTSTSITIDGYTFRFEHLKRVSCAGWGHIALALNETTSVVEEILNLPEVHKLKDPIMDQYAWEIDTKQE